MFQLLEHIKTEIEKIKDAKMQLEKNSVIGQIGKTWVIWPVTGVRRLIDSNLSVNYIITMEI